MPRYRLTLEYDGGPYCGFQAQAGQTSVQAEVERALTAFCGETVRVHAAGRTDAGVHASGQVVHVELAKDWPAAVVMNAVNAHLAGAPIAVLTAEIAAEDFHARFSARGRRYLYRILNRPAPPALEAGHVWHVRAPLRRRGHGCRRTPARRSARLHHFLRDAACQAASPVKTLDEARVERVGDEVRLTFAARSFLHRQVRSMAGSLAQVGLGRWSAADLKVALDAADRAACGPVAPATGLCLIAVDYPEIGYREVDYPETGAK